MIIIKHGYSQADLDRQQAERDEYLRKKEDDKAKEGAPCEVFEVECCSRCGAKYRARRDEFNIRRQFITFSDRGDVHWDELCVSCPTCGYEQPFSPWWGCLGVVPEYTDSFGQLHPEHVRTPWEAGHSKDYKPQLTKPHD
jgi:hypothetical protein